jgi:CheY-like chemotaxis protein
MNKWRALVAEDSAHVLFSLEALLEGSGIAIVGAAATVNGMLSLARTVAADVAILDVNLNGEMVFPAADLLIELGVPIVFTTGYAPENLFPAHLLGQPVLQKPYDPDEFLRLVETAILRTKASREKV